MSSTSFKYIHKLLGKRILIFGASSGFGFAVAEAAIEHGSTVILSGSNQNRLDNAVDRLKASYAELLKDGQISTAVCDLGKLDTLATQLKELLAKVTNNGENKLDHIVFTADDSHRGPSLPDITPEHIHLWLRFRTFSSTILAKVLADTETEYLSRSTEASLTFTNGVGAHKPVKGWAVPGMASAALEGLVRGLAVDLAPIRVNLVSAGPVATDMFSTLPQEYIDMYVKETLLGQLSKPEDIAEAYLYIMKDGGVTGSVVFSDAGRRLV